MEQTETRTRLKAGKLIAFSVVPAALILCLAEIGVRIWLARFASPGQFRKYSLLQDIPRSTFRVQRHHYLNFAPTPGWTKGLTSHNSLGYRSDEFPVKKPEGVFRIVLLGGSSTYTEFVRDNAKAWSAQLQRLLRGRYGYRNVQVISGGAPEYNSWESLINLEFRVLDLGPDLIIIYHGTNDVHARLVCPPAYRGDNSGRRKPWTFPRVAIWDRSCLLRVLRRRYGYAEQAGIEDCVVADTARCPQCNPSELLDRNRPIYFRRNLINMIAVSRANGAKVMLATWAYSPLFDDYASTPYYQEGFDENNVVVREAAKSQGAPLFDFAAVMPRDKRYWHDGRHVNEEGALRKAELFARYLHDQAMIRE